MLDDVVEVATEDVAQAIVLLLERTKLVVEGAGAVGIAALLEGKIAGIELTLLTRDDAHCTALLEQMRGWGYSVERVR